MTKFLAGLLLVFAGLLPSAFGQTLFYKLFAPVPYSKTGWSVSGVGDINSDGFDDFAFGAIYSPGQTISANEIDSVAVKARKAKKEKIEKILEIKLEPVSAFWRETGAVYVHSGRDGSLIYELHGDTVFQFNWFGYNVSGGGDMDGDAVPDFMVGSVEGVFVYSGKSGQLLHRVDEFNDGEPTGVCAALDDVNEDGRADFIVANPYGGESFQGKIGVYSGADGGLIYEKYGDTAYQFFGWSVARSEGGNFIVGALGDANGIKLAGSVYLYSGASGAVLQHKTGERNLARIGWSVAGVDDVNGEGSADFMAGAPYDSIGSAYVWCGATGNLIHEFHPVLAGKEFAYAVAGAGDMNNDGWPDLAIGERFAPFENGREEPGRVYFYSGSDASLLGSVRGDSGEHRLGWSIAKAGDVNRDGRQDVIAGAPSACIDGDYLYSGGVFVYGFPSPFAADCPQNQNIKISRSEIGAIIRYPKPDGRVCMPASGSFLPEGRWVVNCYSADDYCWFFVNIHQVGK